MKRPVRSKRENYLVVILDLGNFKLTPHSAHRAYADAQMKVLDSVKANTSLLGPERVMFVMSRLDYDELEDVS